MTATATPPPSPVKTYEELEPLEGGSDIKGGARHIGQVGRNAGRVVRWQIFVNCTVSNGAESTPRDHAVAMHEIPLLRRRYGMSGSVEPRPHWVSGVARAQGLTEVACRDEEERLKRSYGEVFAAVYGGANGVPCSLWTKVLDLTRAWNEMQERCMALDRRITAEDINGVLKTIEPQESLIEDLGASPLDAGTDTAVNADANVSVDGELLLTLTENGIADDQAKAFATEVAKAGGPELSDEAWARVPRVGRNTMKRTRLLSVYEAHVGG